MKKRSIALSADIVQVIADHLDELSAGSVAEYVETVLRTTLMEAGYMSPYSPEEEQQVENRLRDLGYLD